MADLLARAPFKKATGEMNGGGKSGQRMKTVCMGSKGRLDVGGNLDGREEEDRDEGARSGRYRHPEKLFRPVDGRKLAR